MVKKLPRLPPFSVAFSSHHHRTEAEQQEKDLVRQGFSKEQIDFAETEFYNDRGEKDAYRTGKRAGEAGVETAGQDIPSDKEQGEEAHLEREAIQSEQRGDIINSDLTLSQNGASVG